MSQKVYLRYYALKDAGGYSIRIVTDTEPLRRGEYDALEAGEELLYGPCPTYEEVVGFIRDIEPDVSFEDEDDISPYGDLL